MRLFLALPVLLAALALAGGAAAAGPRLAVFDIHTDLAVASHNLYGDVKVWKSESALAQRARGATLVRCGGDCTYGSGWLAFTGSPALARAEVAAAKAERTKFGWSVLLTLTPRGTASWTRFSRKAALSGKTRGVPDPLVLVLEGAVVAQPLASQVRAGKTTLEIPGLSRANARRTATLFG